MRTLTSIAFLVAFILLAHSAPADDSFRPLYHFTAQRGWINDPNGLVYDGTQYHLFFQHFAGGTQSNGENLTWGHAVSTDLLHWKQLPEAIEPMQLSTGQSASAQWLAPWSGTATMDLTNTSGFGSASHGSSGNPPMLLFWTATHLGQCMAYSTDHGQTFTHYANNPIIPKPPQQQTDWDRDPDVFWYEPGKHWVMIYSISGKGYLVNTSTDLKHWTPHGIIQGFYECPNCFELPVDGNPNNRKWVLWDASGKYQIGDFDGQTFNWQAGPFKLDLGTNYYAAQTWNNAPGNRRVSITWMNGSTFPNQPFNQQLGIPSELSIKTFPGQGMRLTKYPVAELEKLRYDEKQFNDLTLKPNGENPLSDVHGEALDIDSHIDRPAGATFTLTTAGQQIIWNDDKLSVGNASADLNGLSTLDLRILIDRASLEVYANHGQLSFTDAFVPDGKPKNVTMAATSGDVKITSLNVWQLHSAVANQ